MEIKNVLIFLIALFLVGCARTGGIIRPNGDSRQEYVVSHHELSPEIKHAILQGTVIKGMTKEQVRFVWGESLMITRATPGQTVYNREGLEEWSYKLPWLSWATHKTILFTSDGKVYRVENEHLW
ncbi:MAG: hypothetical protein HQL18_03545 [Candidatus Omnitrophica bacterium]|nr:hypothetical protein [Candidatus Omnitrophota bacterium]